MIMEVPDVACARRVKEDDIITLHFSVHAVAAMGKRLHLVDQSQPETPWTFRLNDKANIISGLKVGIPGHIYSAYVYITECVESLKKKSHSSV